MTQIMQTGIIDGDDDNLVTDLVSLQVEEIVVEEKVKTLNSGIPGQ
ncbi:MAG: hypothetical protein AB2669_05910 [Candidatus Thiodiazotropha endolucinida]